MFLLFSDENRKIYILKCITTTNELHKITNPEHKKQKQKKLL